MLFHSGNKRNGFVLVTSLLAAAILLIITIPYVSRVATEYKLMQKVYSATAALDLAEAGVDRALWEINYNSHSFSSPPWTATVDNGSNHGRTISVNAFQVNTGQAIGDYDVAVSTTDNWTNSTITGTGYVPNRTRPDGKRVIKVTCATVSGTNFGKAVLSGGNITVSGNPLIDSYDSSLGSYDSQTHTSYGDIASNATITFVKYGSHNIKGNANPGPGHPMAPSPDPSSWVTGSYAPLTAPATIDPIPQTAFDTAKASNNNANIIKDPRYPAWSPLTGYALKVDGDKQITLPAGTYYFTSMTVSNSGKISLSGTAIIFVEGGAITVGGAGIINSQQPKDLQIYSSGTTITDSNGADLVAGIYAPNASVSITGDADFYGAITCGSETLSNSGKIHYDLNLKTVAPVFENQTSNTYSWQEIT